MQYVISMLWSFFLQYCRRLWGLRNSLFFSHSLSFSLSLSVAFCKYLKSNSKECGWLESRLWVIKTLKRILSDYCYKIVNRLEYFKSNKGILSNSALLEKIVKSQYLMKLRLIAAKSCFEVKHSQYTQRVFIIEAVL